MYYITVFSYRNTAHNQNPAQITQYPSLLFNFIHLFVNTIAFINRKLYETLEEISKTTISPFGKGAFTVNLSVTDAEFLDGPCFQDLN